MKIKDSPNYARREHKRPAHIVLAFAEPEQINSVVLQDRWRLRIVRELTRDEFVAQMRKNRTYPDCVSAKATIEGARLLLDDAVDMIEVPPAMKYFYAAELI